MLEDSTDSLKIIKLDHNLTLHIEINTKWIEYLDIRPKIVKIKNESLYDD